MRKARICDEIAVPGVVGVGVVPGRLAKAAETTTHSFLSAKKPYKQKRTTIFIQKRTTTKLHTSSALYRYDDRSIHTSLNNYLDPS